MAQVVVPAMANMATDMAQSVVVPAATRTLQGQAWEPGEARAHTVPVTALRLAPARTRSEDTAMAPPGDRAGVGDNPDCRLVTGFAREIRGIRFVGRGSAPGSPEVVLAGGIRYMRRRERRRWTAE